MNFFVAVIFFCLPGDCSFWKADQVFDTKEQCEATVAGALNVFESKAEIAAGACLKIKLARA